jgi:hypothetical protein
MEEEASSMTGDLGFGDVPLCNHKGEATSRIEEKLSIGGILHLVALGPRSVESEISRHYDQKMGRC